MVLIWMLYAGLVAGLVGLAALAAERALRATGRQARRVWTAALVASLLVPLGAWLVAGAPGEDGAAGALAAGPVEVVGGPSVEAGSSGTAWHELIRAVRAADEGAVRAWGLAAGVLALLFGAAAVRLALSRRRWKRTEVEGETVRVSRDVGPAVVGLVRPEIVLPSWVLETDAISRRWIVRHETEHVRAGDPARVAAALVAAVLLPWNLPLWWQLRRLRQAVELDCDQRVLERAGPDARRRYGELLLEVGRRSGAWTPVPAGFAETGSFLERRIRSMTESTSSRSLRRAALPAAAGVVLLVASCMVPGPDRPSSPTAPDVPMEPEEVPVDVSRAEPSDEDELARAPTFTPYSVAPKLRNVEEVQRALEREYPPLLRDAGISGRVLLYFFIDDEGRLRDVRINRSSGHEELDEAALRVADAMRFEPARNRDDPVPVWISLPITFQVRPEPAEGGGLEESPEAREDRLEPDLEKVTAPADEAETELDVTAVEELPSAPSGPGLADEPTFTPYTRAPRLVNEPEVQATLEREYPPLLRDAGVGGKALVYFFIDDEGVVRDVRLKESSGRQELDAAALRVARAMSFSPALNRDDAVPVWISIPITFQVR